jgi:hypothetical protein
VPSLVTRVLIKRGCLNRLLCMCEYFFLLWPMNSLDLVVQFFSLSHLFQVN